MMSIKSVRDLTVKGIYRGLAGLTALTVALYTGGVEAKAAQGGQKEHYTYTVTLHLGNHGRVKAGASGEILSGSYISEAGASVDISEDGIRVNGLSWEDQLSFQAQDLVEMPDDSKYYVKGVRLSGRDDSSANASYRVRGDQDFVVAYGVRGNMAAYVVNYQDASGNTLAESRTYYGNVGDRPVVAFRYIEGYEPQAYNLTKTLSANEAENVFTFIYTAVETGGGTNEPANRDDQQGGGGVNAPASNGQGGSAPGAADPEAPAVSDAAPAPGTPAAPAAPGGAAAPAGPEAPAAPAAGEDDGPGPVNTPEDPGVDVPDDEVPLNDGPEELVNLDDDEVPLADIPGSQEAARGRRMGAVAVAAGIVGAAALIGLFVWLWMQRKKEEENA